MICNPALVVFVLLLLLRGLAFVSPLCLRVFVVTVVVGMKIPFSSDPFSCSWVTLSHGGFFVFFGPFAVN